MKWPLCRFEEVALPTKGAIVSGPFGSNISSRFFVEEGVPVIRGNNLTFGQRRFIDDGFVYLREEKAQEFRNCVAITDDLVFTAAGTIGQVGIIPADTRFDRYIISNKQLRVRCDRSKVNPLFLFLWFTTEEMRQHIINKNTGCSIPLINLGILRGLPVPNPPLAVQERIASTISTYDDLIENNRRRMALLEESARTLYREWLVSLHFPGHEHARIVDGVPEGWEPGCVSDFYDTASGGTPSRTNPDFFTGETPWVKTQELLNGFVTETEEKITEDALRRSAAKVFPDRTVLVAMYGATIGQIGIIASPAASNQACCAIIPRDTRASFVHAFLFFLENKDKLVGLSMGAAQNNINQQIIRSYPMVMPTRRLAQLFQDTLTPVFEQWLNLHR